MLCNDTTRVLSLPYRLSIFFLEKVENKILIVKAIKKDQSEDHFEDHLEDHFEDHFEDYFEDHLEDHFEVLRMKLRTHKMVMQCSHMRSRKIRNFGYCFRFFM